MNNASSSKRSLNQTLWVVLRFAFFGLGGLGVLFASSLAFGLYLAETKLPAFSPWLSLPLTFIAALMMLFGTGKWGQWRYLLAFLFIPCTLWLSIVVPGNGSKEGFFFFLVAVAFGICALLRILEVEKTKPPSAKRTEDPSHYDY